MANKQQTTNQRLENKTTKGTSGYTPLHYAARAGRLEAARLLLARGAAPDARTAAGRATPLHRAAHVGCVPLIELL